MEDCNYQLLFKTSAACSTEALHKKSLEKMKNDCTIKNPLTNELYDLRSFKNQDFNVRPRGSNEIFRFSVCKSLTTPNCPAESGVYNTYFETSIISFINI